MVWENVRWLKVLDKCSRKHWHLTLMRQSGRNDSWWNSLDFHDNKKILLDVLLQPIYWMTAASFDWILGKRRLSGMTGIWLNHRCNVLWHKTDILPIVNKACVDVTLWNPQVMDINQWLYQRLYQIPCSYTNCLNYYSASLYRYKFLYVNLLVTNKQKPAANT